MNKQQVVNYEVRLSISRDKMMRYYQGNAKMIVTQTRCGTTLQLAAKHLRPFLDHSGVHGVFRLTLSSDNRLISMEPIG